MHEPTDGTVSRRTVLEKGVLAATAGVAGFSSVGSANDPGSSGADRLPHVLVVDGTDQIQWSSYLFRVSGSVEHDHVYGSIDSTDSVFSGGTVQGGVRGGRDAYRFDGVVRDLTVEGPARVHVLIGTRPPDEGLRLPHFLVVEGRNPYRWFFYRFLSSGRVAKDGVNGSRNPMDRIRPDGLVTGAVNKGRDAYQFDGDVRDLTVQRSARVHVVPGHETMPCEGVAVGFEGCRTARVDQVTAGNVRRLTVFYYDADGVARKREGLDPTTDAAYGPVSVRYPTGPDQATVSVDDDGAIRRVVAVGPRCQTARTNPDAECAGENRPPTADFGFGSAEVGDPVEFDSLATDPDGELVHYGWDFDGDGVEDEIGDRVTHTFEEAGEHAVTHAVVDDFEATDSVTKTVSVEPGTRFREVAKLLAADAEARDRFGESVAVDGDTALVGARFDDDNGDLSGSAYVFARSRSNGRWSQQAKLVADDGGPVDFFGNAVAVDGDTALVGSPTDGDGPGAAYVFERTDGSWTQRAKLVASDGEVGDQLGWSVALDGDVALAGAFRDDDNGDRAGAAYVFERSDGSWGQRAKLVADDGATRDKFGETVALDGDVALVGAPWDDDDGRQSGSAYVFERSGGSWRQVVQLAAADADPNDFFGESLALDGTTALVGAPRADDGDVVEAGAVYVFARSDGRWSQRAKLARSDGADNDSFGESVAIAGDTAVVGVPGDDGPTEDVGAAALFTRSDGAWTHEADLTASDGDHLDYFAQSVALDGDAAVLGTSYDDEAGNRSGSAYVFER